MGDRRIEEEVERTQGAPIAQRVKGAGKHGPIKKKKKKTDERKTQKPALSRPLAPNGPLRFAAL